MGLKQYYEGMLGDADKAHKCALWAFGKGFENVSLSELPERWNKLHGRIYLIKDSGNPYEDSCKIINLWREHMSKKKAPKVAQPNVPLSVHSTVANAHDKRLNTLEERFSGLHNQVKLYAAGVDAQGERLIKAQQSIEKLAKVVEMQDTELALLQKTYRLLVKDNGQLLKGCANLVKVGDLHNKDILAIEKVNHKLTQQGKDMDKKMHAITKRLKTAERDIAKHKPKVAAKVLKKAEKANEKLVKIDKNVRDPMIAKAKQAAKTGVKLPKNFGKVR